MIAQFEGPSGDVLPTEALDLSSASDVFKLMEAADALDPARLAEAVAGAQDSGGGGLVRLRAYAASGGDGPPQLSIANFFGSEEPALRVAAMIGQPIAHVGWDQLLSHERGVPDTEVVLVFPAPFAALSSVPIDDAVFEAARRGSASMIARLSAPMQMPGAVGPSLVAVVTPLMYEVYEDGIGGAQRVLARPELSEAEVAPQQSVFLPSGWWYVLKGAELKGVDLDTHIAAVFDRARLFRGDTFARLDAIEAARATLDTMPGRAARGRGLGGGAGHAGRLRS